MEDFVVIWNSLGVLSDDADEMVELEDYVSSPVTATVHERLTLTCRQGEHSADDQVTWYRDRCASDVSLTHLSLLLSKILYAGRSVLYVQISMIRNGFFL